MALEFQPISLNQDNDTEGMLILHDGRLAGVLSRLSAEHSDRAGRWFLECGFGSLARGETDDFEDLNAARRWIDQKLKD